MLKSGRANLKLFDTAGRLVKTVFEGGLNHGLQEIELNTSELANGVYLLVLESNSTKQTAKIIKLH